MNIKEEVWVQDTDGVKSKLETTITSMSSKNFHKTDTLLIEFLSSIVGPFYEKFV